MARHEAFWSLVAFVGDGEDGQVPVDFDAAALVVRGCGRDLTGQPVAVVVVGPGDGAEAVATTSCPSCGRAVRVPAPPWEHAAYAELN